MAQFQPTVNIWGLDDDQRAALQPGQWVKAGAGGPLGRWCGQGKGSSVAAWNDNAKKSTLGFHGYWRNLRQYALRAA